ncbi:hypothetical protein AB7M18_003658 [Pseudomonas viridiflava]
MLIPDGRFCGRPHLTPAVASFFCGRIMADFSQTDRL